MTYKQARSLGALVFNDFETLDLFGPIQMFGSTKGQFGISIVAQNPGQVTGRQGQRVTVDHTFADDHSYDLILVPGGLGVWEEVNNPTLLNWLQHVTPRAEIVMTVCTGTALLAKAGLLDGQPATTNKTCYDWVTQFGTGVDWQKRARWLEHGRFFTSSGVSAGMDMSLAVIAHLLGEQAADATAAHVEYQRQTDPDNDPFALA